MGASEEFEHFSLASITSLYSDRASQAIYHTELLVIIWPPGFESNSGILLRVGKPDSNSNNPGCRRVGQKMNRCPAF